MRDTMAPGMNWWLDGWQQQVDELRKERGGERNEEWQQLLEGDGIPRSLTVVDPMLTTQWDQDEPYNSVSLNGYGYTFGEQTANFGATVYDWDNMLDRITPASPDVQKAAVATLMYHCGVASDMYYGSAYYGGSGTYIHTISPSIVTPGNYKVNWQVRCYNSSVSESYTLTVDTVTFNDTVNSTKWQSREVLFSVAEGDTVCLDFCYLSQDNSGGILLDNVIIEQILNYTITVSANPTDGGTVTGDGTYQQGESCTVTATSATDYTFTNWTENNEVVSEEMTYTFVVDQNRDLVANFEYTEGIGEQSVFSVVLYPNPVNDELTLEAHEAIGTLEIYNLMGAMVYSRKNCGNNVKINTADLQRGVYFIHWTNDKVSETRRFV